MAFIKASVGRGGVNNADDVKVIQWLLNRAESGYKFMNNLVQEDINVSGVKESGVLSPSTQIAIDDWTWFCDRKRYPKDKPPVYRGFKLEPDSQYYRRLIFGVVLKGTGKVLENIDDNYQDPRIKQALDGRITFEQFKVIVEQAKGKVLTALGKQMQKYARDSKVKAFLDMIAWAEGADKEVSDGKRTGYDVMYGGTDDKPKYMPNPYQHPGVAAGRYQAVTVTWREATNLLGLYDITPESQEIFGVYALHTKRKGLLDAILQNRFADAIEIGSLEWASFPNRAASAAAGGDVNSKPTSALKYGSGPKKGQPQPAKSLNELARAYDDSLKNYTGEAGGAK